ncbi:MAG: hypothetical protein A2W76_11020 [Gammaproteobacteria bacterium RIFCSPLOWO2_12_47_11]|nr:MAG: hypothetical protein A2W76_11020 [Gammaproteobacteria bacterium RIFCSPLOWO2_12_47_11]OGT83161.1 MAG: hypothetical protein A3G42_07485 [Gammaproteobacteria bacterium RIFCSPLOWO2_12_FULL_47_76]
MENYVLAETLEEIFLKKLSLDTYIDDFNRSKGGIASTIKINTDEKNSKADFIVIFDIKLEGFESDKNGKIILKKRAFIINIVAKAIYGKGNNKKEASLAFEKQGSAVINQIFMWVSERVDKCIHDIGIRTYKTQNTMPFSQITDKNQIKKKTSIKKKRKSKKKITHKAIK